MRYYNGQTPPKARVNSFAVLSVTRPKLGNFCSSILTEGPLTDNAPITFELASKMGDAIQRNPSEFSSSSTAYPSVFALLISRKNSPSSTILFRVKTVKSILEV